MAKVIEQAQIATQAKINPLQEVTQLAFFNEDGTPFVFEGGSAPTWPDSTAVGALNPLTDADVDEAAGANPTAAEYLQVVNMVNSLKFLYNNLITALQTGIDG